MAVGDITVLDTDQFASNYISGIATTKSNTDKFVHVANTVNISSIAGSISSDTLSYGSEYSVYSRMTDVNIGVCRISDDKVMAVYPTSGAFGYGIIGTISGSVITWGTAYSFSNPKPIGQVSMELIDTDKVLIFFEGYGGAGYAKIATISGTTISYGSFYSSGTDIYLGTSRQNIAVLSPTKVMITYRDDDNSYYGTAKIATISGTTISFGSSYVFKSASTWQMCARYLDTDKILITYGGSTIESVIANVSGTTITFGSAETEVSTYTSLGGILLFTFDDFYICVTKGYTSGGSGHSMTARASKITGTTYTHYTRSANFLSSIFTTASQLSGDLMDADSGEVIMGYRNTSGYPEALLFNMEMAPAGTDVVVNDVELELDVNSASVTIGSNNTINDVELELDVNSISVTIGSNNVINDVEIDFIPNSISVTMGSNNTINDVEINFIPNSVGFITDQNLLINDVEISFTPNSVYFDFGYLGKEINSNSTITVDGLKSSKPSTQDEWNSKVNVEETKSSKAFTEDSKNSKIEVETVKVSSIL